MNFSERCARASHMLEQLRSVVEKLDKEVCELEVSRHDEAILVRLVQGFLVCNRLSEEILDSQLPAIEQEMAPVGAAMRLAHEELMRRARGAHTDMEIYTKRRQRRNSAVIPIRHAV